MDTTSGASHLFEQLTTIGTLVSLFSGLGTGLAAGMAFYKKRFIDKDAELAAANLKIDMLQKRNFDLAYSNSELDREIKKVSPAEVLKTAQKELDAGNVGSIFYHLTDFFKEVGEDIASASYRLSQDRISYALANQSIGDLREARRLITLAHSIAPDNKEYAELDEEMGLKLLGAAITDEKAPANVHELVDWLHLRDPEDVRAAVRALSSEASKEILHGRCVFAVSAGQAARSLALRLLPSADEVCLRTGGTLASALRARGKYVEAEALARETWQRQKTALPPGHPDTVTTSYVLAAILRDLGRDEEAEPVARQAWDDMKIVLPPDDLQTLSAGYVLASILRNLGRQVEAEGIARQVCEKMKTLLPADDLHVLISGIELATILARLGRYDEAESIAREIWETRSINLALNSSHPVTAGILLATILHHLGRNAEER